MRSAHIYKVFGKLGRPDFVRRPNLKGFFVSEPPNFVTTDSG